MYLSIKARGERAHVLSHLLSKNPHNAYDRMEKGNRVRLVFPEFSETIAEAFLYVTPDPVGLVRNSPQAYGIEQYINDREIVVSSLFCSSIRNALGTALNGKPREEYAPFVQHPFDLELSVGPVASSLSDDDVQHLFGALGYKVDIEYPEASYGFTLKEKSTVRALTLRAEMPVQTAIRHLFVLLPVLDDYKHYFVDEREVEKLERYGEGWLQEHPMRELILRRTLRFCKLIQAVEKTREEPQRDEDEATEEGEANPVKVRLNELRYSAIINVVEALPAKAKIVDFGSGEGKLAVRLAYVQGAEEVWAVEPSAQAQMRAKRRFAKVSEKKSGAIPTPVWGSLFYYDDRLCDTDIMILCEVIEHIDEGRLPKVIKTIMEQYRPRTLIVTTPNREFNEVYGLEDSMRHDDHRFEWTREQFREWAKANAESHSYEVDISGIGDAHEEWGQPTQMAVFTRRGEAGK